MKQMHIVLLNGAVEFIPNEDMKVIFVGKFVAAFWA